MYSRVLSDSVEVNLFLGYETHVLCDTDQPNKDPVDPRMSCDGPYVFDEESQECSRIICDDGFEIVGDECKSIDDCLDEPCPQDAKCVDGHKTYTCKCSKGYEMNDEKTACELQEEAHIIYKYVDSFSPENWFYDEEDWDISLWKVLRFDKKWCSLGDMIYSFGRGLKDQSIIPARVTR